MKNWYNSLSIRWKLQIGFFMVTMITTVYNRMLASHELGQMVGRGSLAVIWRAL